MDDKVLKQELQVTENEDNRQGGITQVKEEIETAATISSVDTTASKTESEVGEAQKKKISKKTWVIIGGILAIIVIAIIIIAFIPSKFDKVKNECVQIAGQLSSGKNYFTLDTDPYEEMNEALRSMLLPDTQEKTLAAIKYANEELGFPGSVYSDMLKTSALMGRQSEENNKYKVSWTYHPKHGLEVTYTKK